MLRRYRITAADHLRNVGYKKKEEESCRDIQGLYVRFVAERA